MKRFRPAGLTAGPRGYAIALTLVFLLLPEIAGIANASLITVTSSEDLAVPGLCKLREAIESHNNKAKPPLSSCAAGTGNDVIDVPSDQVDLGNPIEVKSGTVTFQSLNTVCSNWRGATYLTIDQGAEVTLEGVGIVPNGSRALSAIDNDGGNLAIQATARSGICRFSNEGSTIPETGGVLFNRNSGTTTIRGANFAGGRARSSGGAIYIDSGTVKIGDSPFASTSLPSLFTLNSIPAEGGAVFSGKAGAIFVNLGATLMVASSNFAFTKNTAEIGAAIYSNGGNVTIKRGAAAAERASIASNTALTSTIVSNGGQLNIDGIEITLNEGSGSVIEIDDSSHPAAITRTFLHNNFGGGIELLNSVLDLSGDTISYNGLIAIELQNSATANIINSTFLGFRDEPALIDTFDGTTNMTFSTMEMAAFRGHGPNLSNSILSDVSCEQPVVDKGDNLQFESQTPGESCSSTIIVEDPLLDPGLLRDNGGLTPTIGLLGISPAIDQIAIGACLDLDGHPLRVDQRGFGRPFPAGGSCDIGAFEFGAH